MPRSLAVLAAVLASIAARAAEACTVCFGNADSQIVKSAETGVWFLLGVILSVQVGFAIFFFVYLRKRSRRVRDPHPMLRLVKNS